MIVVPRPTRRLHVEAAAEQADALAHADEAERVLAHALGGEADAVVLDQDTNRRCRSPVMTTLTACACACLMMFVSASWTIR